MARPVDALHGGIRRHPHLDALARCTFGEYGEEVFHRSAYVVWGARPAARLRRVEPLENRAELVGRQGA